MNEPVKLPEFRGYTVDVKLGEFRQVKWNFRTQTPSMKVIPFYTEKGAKLLEEYLRGGK